MTTETTPKPQRKRKKVSVAELQRQIRALKEDVANKDQIIAGMQEEQEAGLVELTSPLSDRWDAVLGEVETGLPIYYLDGDEDDNSGNICEVDQGEGRVLYQVEVGAKTAYFDDIEDAGEQGERWVDGPKFRNYAIDRPTAFNTARVESNEQQIGQDRPREMRSTGPASEALDPLDIQPVQKVYSKDKMDMLAFMEQELEVIVHDTTNEQDIPIPCFQNDGITQYFIRGQAQTVKRKFVEVLARCKKTSYTQEMYVDASGADAYRQVPHTVLMYPFAVNRDPDPRGAAWLKQILSEG